MSLVEELCIVYQLSNKLKLIQWSSNELTTESRQTKSDFEIDFYLQATECPMN